METQHDLLVPTDYSNPDHWVHITKSPDKPVDIFYVCPTSYLSKPGDPDCCTIDNLSVKRAVLTVFSVQATPFFTMGNVFSPFYRMMSYETAIRVLTGDARLPLPTPTADVEAAFRYFIDHFNQGRPFIILTNSQSAFIAQEMIKKKLGDEKVYGRMIAAYLIGNGITAQMLREYPHMKFAEGERDTGVIVSYNTEEPGCARANPTAPEGSLCINPLNWRRDETYAPAELNLGSVFTGGGILEAKRQFADAQVDLVRGTLICSTVPPAVYGMLNGPLGTFHNHDFGMYVRNFVQNAKTRIQAYFDQLEVKGDDQIHSP